MPRPRSPPAEDASRGGWTSRRRPLGGGVPGDIVGLPRSPLAVLPGTTHVALVDCTDWLLSMVSAFLDAPMLKAK